MAHELVLTDKEQALRSLLLDVSNFIHAQKDLPRPELRITGGWVRDKLLGMNTKDIDVGIDSMTGHKFALFMKEFVNDRSKLSNYGEGTVNKIAKIAANPEKSKHLETATTSIFGLDIDFVNLRKETYADESRNPQVEIATPEEDALRRDATVNALFYNLQTEKIEDFTGRGLKDLDDKIIRTPLEPFQTFKDDPLRVLRSIRFASRFNYSIEPRDLDCMKDKVIQEALRAKISRERIGIEIEKMLKGPNPRNALELIESQTLYETIFADPARADIVPEQLGNWQRAYRFVDLLLNKRDNEGMNTLRKILLPYSESAYEAWLLASLSPWATAHLPLDEQPNNKAPFSLATVSGREGLKIDNKLMAIVKHAVEHSREIASFKDAFTNQITLKELPAKRKQEICSRESLGMAVRRWGRDWRSSTLYAILLEVMQHEDYQSLTANYASWLSELERLQLLEAYDIKPLLDGKQLMKTMDRKGGPWVAKALDLVMEWQLQNPDSTDTVAAIEDVKERLNEKHPGT